MGLIDMMEAGVIPSQCPPTDGQQLFFAPHRRGTRGCTPGSRGSALHLSQAGHPAHTGQLPAFDRLVAPGTRHKSDKHAHPHARSGAQTPRKVFKTQRHILSRQYTLS